VVSRFRAAIERAKPSSGADVIVCWDGPGSWRRDIFPAYKANRGQKPEALVRALEECRSVFPGYVAPGFEADDLIATFARQAPHAHPVVILSEDKDIMQLVGMHCFLVTSRGEVYDVARVEAKFGVPPNRLRHLLSWTGDKVDALDGIVGFGPKRAIAKALAGEIGNRLTHDLTELANVPRELMIRRERW
jgi:DNA polymerase-1